MILHHNALYNMISGLYTKELDTKLTMVSMFVNSIISFTFSLQSLLCEQKARCDNYILINTQLRWEWSLVSY